MTSSYNTIGRSVGRAEGPAKVTGQAIYPADVNLPGTLVGKCLRSPFPYAKIVSIDADSVAAARRLPGVHAVLTAADIPPHLVGRMLRELQDAKLDGQVSTEEEERRLVRGILAE